MILNIQWCKPINQHEKTIYDINQEVIVDMISRLNNDNHFLGGVIKMNVDELLVQSIVDKVRQIKQQRSS